MATKYKVIAPDGVRIAGKHVPAGSIIDLPPGANLAVALQLKQIAPDRSVAEPPAPAKKK